MPGKLSIEELGITKATEGPPLPKKLGVGWPEPVGKYLREHWPGTPFPRSWGEAAIKRLPLGIGTGVQEIVNRLGL